jgi:acyl-CoA synthetase (AMP-forming)/AMP-acid ligase II
VRPLDLFDRAAALFPERVCVADDEAELTFAEASRRSHVLANALRRAGVAVEDKVAVYAPNKVEALVAILGVLRSGGAWLPINARNGLDENLAILERCDCAFLLHAEEQAAEAAAIRAKLPLKGAACLDGPEYEAFVAGAGETAPDPGTGPHQLYKLALSGGTTGTPKGVIHTNLNGAVMIASLMIGFPPKKPPVYLCPSPVTHAAGNFALWILAEGGRVQLMRKADPGAILANIETHRATCLFVPPTVLYLMIAHETARGRDYSSLDYLFYGAAPASAEKLRQAIALFGPVLAQVYSQAEATMGLTYLKPEDHLDARRLTSAGRPGPLVRLEVQDEDGRECAVGEVGEICIKGDLVSPGYYKDPEATAAGRRNGWLLTSDCAFRDEDGFIHIVDRKRDMIISGGFNVYPSEIEQVISALPGVIDVAIVGVPDEKWGEAVKAIVCAPGASLTEAEVMLTCRERLGGVKTPKSVEFWDELPKSPNGKVLKRAIRDRLWAGRANRLTG